MLLRVLWTSLGVFYCGKSDGGLSPYRALMRLNTHTNTKPPPIYFIYIKLFVVTILNYEYIHREDFFIKKNHFQCTYCGII